LNDWLPVRFLSTRIVRLLGTIDKWWVAARKYTQIIEHVAGGFAMAIALMLGVSDASASLRMVLPGRSPVRAPQRASRGDKLQKGACGSRCGGAASLLRMDCTLIPSCLRHPPHRRYSRCSSLGEPVNSFSQFSQWLVLLISAPNRLRATILGTFRVSATLSTGRTFG
jgi:hypothetical protein